MPGYRLPISIGIRTTLQILKTRRIFFDVVRKPVTVKAKPDLLAGLPNSGNEFTGSAIWRRGEKHQLHRFRRRHLRARFGGYPGIVRIGERNGQKHRCKIVRAEDRGKASRPRLILYDHSAKRSDL